MLTEILIENIAHSQALCSSIAEKGHLEGCKKRVGKTVYDKEEDRASSNWVYYLVPVFWPFLIARILMSGKTRPTDMTPYNYKQHLKSNAR